MPFLVLSLAAAVTPVQDFTPEFKDAMRTVIRGNDFVCDHVGVITGPTPTEHGQEFIVRCDGFHYVVTITPSKRFLVRVR